jgi:uncharacterized protein YndB with AHSA1/START domain
MSPAMKTGVTTLTTPSDQEIAIARVVSAPRTIVWQAWTRCEHLRRWLLGPEGWTMHVCEMDLKVGGAWRYGWRKADGSEMVMGGAYHEVVPPERLVNTERWGPEWPETVNTVTFVEAGGLTTITITLRYPDQSARDAALKSGMKEGMEESFARLEQLLPALR